MTVRPASPKAAPVGSRISKSPSIRIGPLFMTVTFVGIGRLWRSIGLTADLFPLNPLSNRACGFPAHGLPMIFLMWLASDTSLCHAADTDPVPEADRQSKPSDVSPVARLAEFANDAVA